MLDLFRVRRSLAPTLLAVGLVGCGQDYTFRDAVADEDTDDAHGADGPGSGGWGDWDLGDVPDLAIVVGTGRWTGEAEVLVVGLGGRVLDRWTPPPSQREIVSIEAGAPGEVWVTTSWPQLDSFERADLGQAVRPSSLWHGDLVNGTWTQVIALDDATGTQTVVATGQVLPNPSRSEFFVPVPHGDETDRVLGILAPIYGPPRAGLRLALDGVAEERMWPSDSFWTGVPGDHSLRMLRGGLDANDDPTLLIASSLPGYSGSLDVRFRRWTPDAGTEVLSRVEVALDGDGAEGWFSDVAWHAASGTVLAAHLTHEQDGSHARLSWRGDDAFDLDLGPSQELATLGVLDPEHHAFLVAHHANGDEGSALRLFAGGEEVWTIERLREGLGSRQVHIHTGAVVAVPDL